MSVVYFLAFVNLVKHSSNVVLNYYEVLLLDMSLLLNGSTAKKIQFLMHWLGR